MSLSESGIEEAVTMCPAGAILYGGQTSFKKKIELLLVCSINVDENEIPNEGDNYLDFDLNNNKFDSATLFLTQESDMTKIDLNHLSNEHQLKVKKLISTYTQQLC